MAVTKVGEKHIKKAKEKKFAACRNKNQRVVETVKRFNVKNEYEFISPNDTRRDIFVYQISIARTIRTSSSREWTKVKRQSSRSLLVRRDERQPT